MISKRRLGDLPLLQRNHARVGVIAREQLRLENVSKGAVLLFLLIVAIVIIIIIITIILFVISIAVLFKTSLTSGRKVRVMVI